MVFDVKKITKKAKAIWPFFPCLGLFSILHGSRLEKVRLDEPKVSALVSWYDLQTNF